MTVTVTITIVNLALSTIILILGIRAFLKQRADLANFKRRTAGTSMPVKALAIPGIALYIGIAFGLFGISHALTLAGLAKSLEMFIISIRIIAYLLVIVAPARILLKR
jgi:hypothetical protein